MKISVYGLGYVGSVSAAKLAEAGHDVVGVDVNRDKIDTINHGEAPIIEPGLAQLIRKGVTSGRLRATSSSEEAVADSDVALICVGTPGLDNGQLDLGVLGSLCRDIGRQLRERNETFTVVIRSTMLPGSLERVVLTALRAGAGEVLSDRLRVAVNPEFLREGTALQDYDCPPFTLVGCEDEETRLLLQNMYEAVDAPFVSVPFRTAEMVKYACNAFHAVKVCFANEIADACDALGADAQEVMRVFRMDDKLNASAAYLKPGFAFGGSCLPKDIRALTFAARRADVSAPLLASIEPSNRGQIEHAVAAVLAAHKRRIGIVGLSFKPDTDDLRESPMVAVAETLIGKGCDVRILDQNVALSSLVGANRRYIQDEIPHIASVLCEDDEELLDHAEILVIANKTPEAERILEQVSRDTVVVDLTRGLLRASGLKMQAPPHGGASASDAGGRQKQAQLSGEGRNVVHLEPR
ncbi:MAG: nucleotide sugar dehydrogenase [Gammaproteobacteria bacterium]|nr:nucleotide sugar dehydrogenase [Gammaproteobacteria bacterium]